MRIKIFQLERVGPVADPALPPYPMEAFQKLLKHFSKHFEMMPLEGALRQTHKPRSNMPKGVLVFSGGYADFRDHAWPLLKAAGIPATLFVAPGLLEHKENPWYYKLASYLLYARENPLTFQELQLLPELQSLRAATYTERARFVDDLLRLAGTLTPKNRETLLHELSERVDNVHFDNRLMMGWSDLEQLRDEGLHIGCTGKNATPLATYGRTPELEADLQDAYKLVYNHLGQKPVGALLNRQSLDSRVIPAAQKAGFEICLVQSEHFFTTQSDKLSQAPYVPLYDEDWLTTNKRLNGMLPKGTPAPAPRRFH